VPTSTQKKEVIAVSTIQREHPGHKQDGVDRSLWPGEALYRKLIAEAAEWRWEEAFQCALARVAIEREELAAEAEPEAA
jgi:hypothetical protein